MYDFLAISLAKAQGPLHGLRLLCKLLHVLKYRSNQQWVCIYK